MSKSPKEERAAAASSRRKSPAQPGQPEGTKTLAAKTGESYLRQTKEVT